MGSSTVFIFLICLTLGRVLTHPNVVNKTSNDDERIVGGEEAKIQDYPYQALLFMKQGQNTYQCGGSIISNIHILSAAHCFDRIESVDIRIGSNQAFRGGSTYKSTRFISHPNYNSRTYDCDIAIVFLSQRMSLDGTNTARIRIARQNYYPPEGTTIAISGWGATGETESTTTVMRATTVNIHSRSTCQDLLGQSLITNRTFCAGPIEGGKDSCQGDSGGPAKAVVNGIQIGLVSNGFGCARPKSPGIYTNVGSFYAWIGTTTGGLVTFADPNDNTYDASDDEVYIPNKRKNFV